MSSCETENKGEIPLKIRVNNDTLVTSISIPGNSTWKDHFLQSSKRSNLVHTDMKDKRFIVTSPLVYLRYNGSNGRDQLYSPVSEFAGSRFTITGDIRKGEIPYYYATAIDKKNSLKFALKNYLVCGLVNGKFQNIQNVKYL